MMPKTVPRRALLLACLAAGLLPVRADARGGVWVVRHADRDGQHDRLEKPAGERRARDLADRLAGAGIGAVFSTETRRSESTARPLARRLGLEITSYETVAQVVARARRACAAGEVVLIVGHSNTVPKIVEELGAALPATLPLDARGWIHHDDYDNLLFVLPDGEGDAGAVASTYGTPTPPP